MNSTTSQLLEPLWLAPLLAQVLSPRPSLAGDAVDEADLVRRAKGGDPGAMQDLYRRHADQVYRRLTHLIGSEPEREDLLQEVFIAVFAGLKSFRGEARVGTFIYRIVSNKAYDHLKRRQRKAKNATRLADTGVEETGLSPEAQVQQRQEAAMLWSSLDQLKPKKRIAFVLRAVEGLSLQEISEQVGASVPAVAQRIRHAKRELIELEREAREG